MANFNNLQYQMNDIYNQNQQYYQPRTNWQQYYQPQVSTAIQAAYQQPQVMQHPVNNSNIIWVQGEAGMKAYTDIPPGTPIALWDSEEQTIYVKTVDQTGRPSVRILDYKDREVEKDDSKLAITPSVEYATKEQVDVLNKALSSINEKLRDFGKFATTEQLESINGQVGSLSDHISDIEDRITSFGKSQQGNSVQGRKGNK